MSTIHPYTNRSKDLRNQIDACNLCEGENCLVRKYSDVLLNNDTDQNTVLKCKKGQQFIIEGAPVNGLFFIKKGTC